MSRISQSVYIGDVSGLFQGGNWYTVDCERVSLVVMACRVPRALQHLSQLGYFQQPSNTCFVILDPDFNVSKLTPDELEQLAVLEARNSKPLESLMAVAASTHRLKISVPVIAQNWQECLATGSLFVQSLSELGLNVYIVDSPGATMLALSYTMFATSATIPNAVHHMHTVSPHLGNAAEQLAHTPDAFQLLARLRQQAIGMKYASSVSPLKRSITVESPSKRRRDH